MKQFCLFIQTDALCTMMGFVLKSNGQETDRKIEGFKNRGTHERWVWKGTSENEDGSIILQERWTGLCCSVVYNLFTL